MTVSAASSAAASLISHYVSGSSATTAGQNFADTLEQTQKAQKAASASNNGDSGNSIATQFSSLVGSGGSSSAFSAMLLGAGGNTASEMNNQLNDLNII